jgi:hypothetical protein
MAPVAAVVCQSIQHMPRHGKSQRVLAEVYPADVLFAEQLGLLLAERVIGAFQGARQPGVGTNPRLKRLNSIGAANARHCARAGVRRVSGQHSRRSGIGAPFKGGVHQIYW